MVTEVAIDRVLSNEKSDIESDGWRKILFVNTGVQID